MQLFYNPGITGSSEGFSFDREESRHIVKVLRKSNGDNLFVTNGAGSIFTTEITSAAEHKCTVRITAEQVFAKPAFEIHLAVAPTKMMDRYEWFLEKATELGATRITPIICDRSERRALKADRLHKIVQSAMKQSLRAWLPILDEPVDFGEFCRAENIGTKIIAHCEDGQRKTFKQLIRPGENVTVLVGPEGDFTSREITLALENGYLPATLGENRLRTETAAIAACHAVTLINEPS